MQRENEMFPATFSLEVKMEIKHSIFIDWSGSWNSLHNSVIAIKLKKKKTDKLPILTAQD